MNVRVGPQRKLSAEEWMLSNCGAGDSWVLLGQQDQTSPSKANQCWVFIGRTDAEAPILWPPNVGSRLIEKDPDMRKAESRRRRGRQRMRCMDGITDLMDVSKLEKIDKDREACCAAVRGAKSRTRLRDWTTKKKAGVKQNIRGKKTQQNTTAQ